MRALITGLACFLLVGTSLAAVPTDLADRDAAWWRQFNEQIATSLDSDIPNVRSEALATVAYVAERYPERLDAEQLLRPLARLYQQATDVEVRKEALLAFTRLRAAQGG